MIFVDSSVWIDNIRGVHTEAVGKLRSHHDRKQLLVGDLVLLEVLQGARDEAHARRLERDLRTFNMVNMLDEDIAVSAARNFRLLRARGITIRKVIDMVIATYCIEHGHILLHSDRDFTPFVDHLGLRVL